MDTCDAGTIRGYAIVSDDEILHSFSADDPRTQTLSDARVRARTLQVTGWLRPGDVLEIVKLHSVVDGKLHDIQYYCGLCNVTAPTPGKCWCCQQEFTFKEVPKNER